MKPLIVAFLIAILSFAACLFLPWWSIAIVSFIVAALIRQTPFTSFISGFTGVFLLWGILTFYISYSNENILAHRVSRLILSTDNPFLLIVVTALIGAIIAGLAALTGSFIYPRTTANDTI